MLKDEIIEIIFNEAVIDYDRNIVNIDEVADLILAKIEATMASLLTKYLQDTLKKID